MTTEYWPAPEVEAIAAPIIDEHHRGLLECDVVFLFRWPTEERNGRIILGKARKVGGLNAYLATHGLDNLPDPEHAPPSAPVPFFLIEIANEQWQRMNQATREALVDHELTHCVVTYNDDGDQVLKTRGHDLEDFISIAQRRGLWHPAASEYFKAAAKVEQLSIDWGKTAKQVATGTDDGEPAASNVTPIRTTRKTKPKADK